MNASEIKRIKRDFYAQLYTKKLNKLEKMDNFLNIQPTKTELRNKNNEQTNNK